MEVVIPNQEFFFDSTTATTYMSAPSTPKRFGDPFINYYTSAPTSPSRYASIPFDWEEKPGTRKSGNGTGGDGTESFDFSFDFSAHSDRVTAPADELFEKGRIRPFKPPPRLHLQDEISRVASSQRSPRSPKSRGFWSPHHRRGGGEASDIDTYTAAIQETTRETRCSNPNPPSRTRRASRSLSPLRGANTPKPPITEGSSKRWSLKDLFLFRSASEGRATGGESKDPLRKYTHLSSAASGSGGGTVDGGEEWKYGSFRSTDSNGSSMRRVSAHEMHYTANRAAAEEKKKKTPLPYRQGLFGFLRFNPAVHSITKGFNGNSVTRGRS